MKRLIAILLLTVMGCAPIYKCELYRDTKYCTEKEMEFMRSAIPNIICAPSIREYYICKPESK